MNPALKNVVKEELQKLLNVGFIYPLSDSQWVSPLVMVPKNNGKWWICVDYRELNKATQKDHFRLLFIDQVLDTLVGIRYLMNKPVTPGRNTRWLLLLQEFDITIVDKLGKDNVVAIFLSRIEHDGKETSIEDDFMNEHLFVVSANTPWYADIANYLVTGKVPRHLSYKEQRKIIHQST
eukprot:PITA_26684